MAGLWLTHCLHWHVEVMKCCGWWFHRSHCRRAMRHCYQLRWDNVLQRWWNRSSMEHISWDLYKDLWLTHGSCSQHCLAAWQWGLCLLHSGSHTWDLARTGIATDHRVTGAITTGHLCLIKWRCCHQLMVSCTQLYYQCNSTTDTLRLNCNTSGWMTVFVCLFERFFECTKLKNITHTRTHIGLHLTTLIN